MTIKKKKKKEKKYRSFSRRVTNPCFPLTLPFFLPFYVSRIEYVFNEARWPDNERLWRSFFFHFSLLFFHRLFLVAVSLLRFIRITWKIFDSSSLFRWKKKREINKTKEEKNGVVSSGYRGYLGQCLVFDQRLFDRYCRILLDWTKICFFEPR